MSYGFIILAFAWLWQWWKFKDGYRSVDPWFLRLSALGMLIVTLDSFRFGNWLTWASGASLVIILILVYKVRR